MESLEFGSRKQPWTSESSPSNGTGSTSLRSISTSSFLSSRKRAKNDHSSNQMLLCKLNDPNAPALMDVAIADFLHSHCLPFSLADDKKLMRVVEVARTLGPNYNPPSRQDIGGKYLDALYQNSWKQQMATLLSEARIFGVTVFGDGATIKTVPLVNVLAAGVNNPFALLDIADCTEHLQAGGKKDAKHIANIVKPLIELMEGEVDVHKKKLRGIVDLVFFDGASNVQNAGEILRAYNPRITVGHGAEHVVSLFFSDVYTKVSEFRKISDFAKKVRNIFGSTRHSPKAIFEKYSRQHNKGIFLGFIKPSECRMAGEHIALLRLLRLKDALRSTIMSKEFIDLRIFHADCNVLMNPDFWNVLFVMARALYAPMRVLRLADQKVPAMDKLYYYVLQTDRMLPLYIADAEKITAKFFSGHTLVAMERNSSAGLGKNDTSDEDEDDGYNEDDGDNFGEVLPSSDDEDSDDDEQQVSICVSSLHWLKILTFDVVFIFYLLLL